MPDRENDTTSVREHNEKRMTDIKESVRRFGCNRVASWFDVNPYYVSECVNHDKIPSNAEIAEKMGFEVVTIIKTVPIGAPRKKYPRAIVHRTTSVEKIKRDLLEVTGVRWEPMTNDMEY